MINGVLVWKPAEKVLTYRIGSTETDSKYGGTKTYTNYKIHSPVIVSRTKFLLLRDHCNMILLEPNAIIDFLT